MGTPGGALDKLSISNIHNLILDLFNFISHDKSIYHIFLTPICLYYLKNKPMWYPKSIQSISNDISLNVSKICIVFMIYQLIYRMIYLSPLYPSINVIMIYLAITWYITSIWGVYRSSRVTRKDSRKGSSAYWNKEFWWNWA